MHRNSRLLLVILLVSLSMLLVACPKTVEKNEAGPGGLPKGVVDEGTAPDSENDWPTYPDSTERAPGVFETTASMDTVMNYYAELLGVHPEVRDPRGETYTFETDFYILALVPRQVNGAAGTEISFTPTEPSN